MLWRGGVMSKLSGFVVVSMGPLGDGLVLLCVIISCSVLLLCLRLLLVYCVLFDTLVTCIALDPHVSYDKDDSHKV